MALVETMNPNWRDLSAEWHDLPGFLVAPLLGMTCRLKQPTQHNHLDTVLAAYRYRSEAGWQLVWRAPGIADAGAAAVRALLFSAVAAGCGSFYKVKCLVTGAGIEATLREDGLRL